MVLPSTLMLRSNLSHRDTRARPIVRLGATATLVAFLAAQSWVVCAPLCLLHGHMKVASAAAEYHEHIIHCHSDKVIRNELPVVHALGSMLPARSVPLPPPPRVVAIRFAAPAAVHLQHIPSADPPPPRSI